jgi:hypothetical protein
VSLSTAALSNSKPASTAHPMTAEMLRDTTSYISIHHTQRVQIKTWHSFIYTTAL